MPDLKVALQRRAYRVAYVVLKLFWALFHPHGRGVKCVLTCGRDVLLIRHAYGRRERWELPGGFVRPREAPERAARRELAEELSLHDLDLRPLGSVEAVIENKRDTLFCFTAELEGEQRKLDLNRGEIEQAHWFDRGGLPAPLGPQVGRIIALAAGDQ